MLSNINREDSDEAYKAIQKICTDKGIEITANQHPSVVYVVLTDLTFLVSQMGDGHGQYLGGGVRGKSNFVVMWLVKNLTDDKEKMIIHEFGHTLGLNDVYLDYHIGGNLNNPMPSNSLTKSNYMDYYINRKMFFRKQIEIIISNLKQGEE
jgi:hypothetical protein